MIACLINSKVIMYQLSKRLLCNPNKKISYYRFKPAATPSRFTIILTNIQLCSLCEHTSSFCAQSCGRYKAAELILSSIIRLQSPGQTPLVGEDSRQRPCVCVSVCLPTPLYEETQTHPPTGTKHIMPTRHFFHGSIFVLSQHSQWFMKLFGHEIGAQLSVAALCSKPVVLV